jgi:hypothetical protein
MPASEASPGWIAWSRVLIHREREWVLTLGLICAIQFLICDRIALPFFPDIQLSQPFRWLPAHVYEGWDAAWYERLYQGDSIHVWPPGYPLALRLISAIFQFGDQGFTKSAVLLNLLCHAAIVRGLFAYVARFPQRTARGKVQPEAIQPWMVAVLVLFYPAHNSFFAAYSESLYLAVTVWAIISRQRDRLLIAGILAGLSCLVRNQGVFLCAALLADQAWVAFRAKRFELRPFAAVGVGLLILLAWNLHVRLQGVDLFAERQPWIEAFQREHVPEGDSLRVWSITYLAVPGPGRIDWILFWGLAATAVICARRGLVLEAVYIALFYLMLVATPFPPFAWTRWVSPLFFWAVVACDILRGRPRLQLVLILLGILCFLHFQLVLFSGIGGEM